VNRNELNHFGWVVEFDPFNPHSRTVKRTALGRTKHEGATCTESKGRIVVYSGDDENGDYLYKFVGSGPWRALRALGRSPLDYGTLYVAKFNADGSGEWLRLVHGVGPLTEANGWADQADVLIRTRMAGDAVGATRLHRPEWVAVHPETHEVFVTLTNGSGNNGPRL
jgi:secreted PhoX family phosphatase